MMPYRFGSRVGIAGRIRGRFALPVEMQASAPIA